MDVNSFLVSDEEVVDGEVLRGAVVVDQGGEGGRCPARRELVSAARTRAVAVVDRTADVEAAARAIVRARFGFAGRSPYAPDLVLVNEYVKKDFFEACTRFATGVFASRGGEGEGEEEEKVRRMIAEAEGRKEVVSFGSDAFKLIEVLDRFVPLPSPKPDQPANNLPAPPPSSKPK